MKGIQKFLVCLCNFYWSWKVFQNKKLTFFYGMWQRMIQILPFLQINLIVENKAHIYTKETFYHWIPELNTVTCLLTGGAGPPQAIPQEVPSVEEDSRTRALQGQFGSQGKEENRCSAHHTYSISSKLPTHFKSLLLRGEERPWVLCLEFS